MPTHIHSSGKIIPNKLCISLSLFLSLSGALGHVTGRAVRGPRRSIPGCVLTALRARRPVSDQ